MSSRPANPRWARRKSRRANEHLVRWFCLVCALVSVFTTVGIVIVLATEASSFFARVPVWEFLTGRVWQPLSSQPKFGVLPLVTGTLLIMVGSGLISLPLGLLTGVFSSEYASDRVRKVLKPALELLAGIPTVVYGYLALFLVTPLLQKAIPAVEVYNAASGAIVVGIMTLPLVSSLCEDSLRAVPRSLREGAYALGSTKFEVTTRIVIPSALSGVMASFILALSRAVGETMAVSLAAGATPNLTLNPAESIQTMTAYIVQVSRGDVARGTLEYQTIFAVGATLFAMTLVMNLAAQALVKRFRAVYV